MILEKLFKITKKDQKEAFVFGLVSGLGFGLVSGLGFGFGSGLVFGLVFGLGFGIVFGLVSGLVFGLVYFINFFAFLGLVGLITHYPSFIPLWLIIVLGILVLEAFFWFDSQKRPKNIKPFWFTLMKKGEALLETVAIFGYLNLGRLAIGKIKYIPCKEVLKWTGYIGAGIIALALVVGLIYLYVKLNSLKYKLI
jgi:hypothetical protein